MKPRYTGFFDGSCEPNPGGVMGYGAAVFEHDRLLWQTSGIAAPIGGQSTNNLAEYSGLIALLEYFLAAELNCSDIIIKGDSQLAIKQMTGQWRICGGSYVHSAQRARNLVKQFPGISFQWIPRADNSHADSLSKRSVTRTAM